jgi:hypothetical protein
MITWYCVTINDYKQICPIEEKIRKSFTDTYLFNKGQTLSMAAFTKQDLKAVSVYFTPKANEIAKTFNAVPCEKPTIENLGLLVGDQQDWTTFFPGETPVRKRK